MGEEKLSSSPIICFNEFIIDVCVDGGMKLSGGFYNPSLVE
jgi:hypothetical protein